MAKRTKKNDADQKNKQGFDSAKTDSEFSHEVGSHDANQKHKEKEKRKKSSKNDGEYKGSF
ncbi:hypothetical protein [Litchfieldia alkalitelluris]|uniref:hypothetical protein n=1 Tax=Litchfieldia alkalitelluris TaxID=304268 RepID=UPI000997353B|nr:hypothetical protein [Litchfieldia alkalitelluris]